MTLKRLLLTLYETLDNIQDQEGRMPSSEIEESLEDIVNEIKEYLDSKES